MAVSLSAAAARFSFSLRTGQQRPPPRRVRPAERGRTPHALRSGRVIISFAFPLGPVAWTVISEGGRRWRYYVS